MLEPCWCVITCWGGDAFCNLLIKSQYFRGALFQDKYSFSIPSLLLPCLQSSQSISLKPWTSVDCVMFLSYFSLSEAERLEGAGAGRNFPIPVEIKFQNFPQLSPYPWRVSHCYGEGSEQYFPMPTPLLPQDPWEDPSCTSAVGTWLSSWSEGLWKCAPRPQQDNNP